MEEVKLVIAGLDNAGKSTMLLTLQKNYHIGDALAPTKYVKRGLYSLFGKDLAVWDFGGQIFVSFIAWSVYVPPYEGETEEEGTYGNYNFRGSFRITGGNEYYAGLRGRGTIAGTFQHYDYCDAVDFVMMGKARVR